MRQNLNEAWLSCSCSNRAAAYLALGMWDEALKDAERARALAQEAVKKTHKAAPLYMKTFAQKGAALIGESSIWRFHDRRCNLHAESCPH